MSDKPADDVLNRYASRLTTTAEEKSLFLEAASDQDTFDALAQEELLRALLGDPEARKILLKENAPEPVWKTWFAGVFQGKQAWVLAGAVALALIVAAGISITRPHEPVAVLSSAGSLAGLDRLPDDARKNIESILSSRPGNSNAHLTVRVSDTTRVHVSADYSADANLLIVALPDGQAGRILFPNAASDAGPVKAGATVSVPTDPSQGMDLEALANLRLVLLVFRADADPMEAIRRSQALPEPLAVAFREIKSGRP
jgi:hypothetical protein